MLLRRNRDSALHMVAGLLTVFGYYAKFDCITVILAAFLAF